MLHVMFSSRSNSWNAALDEFSVLRVWSVNDRKLVLESETGSVRTTQFASVAFDSDGRFLAASGSEESFQVFEVGTWKQIPTSGRTGGEGALDMMWLKTNPGLLILSNSNRQYEQMGISPKVWPDDVLSPEKPASNCIAMASSPDGRRWFLLEADGRFLVFDPQHHAAVLSRNSGWRDACSISVSSDGNTVATGFIDGTVRMWKTSRRNSQSRPERQELSTFSSRVLAEGTLRSFVTLRDCVALDASDQVILLHLDSKNTGLKEPSADLVILRETGAGIVSTVESSHVSIIPPAFSLAVEGDRCAVIFRERLKGAGTYLGDIKLITGYGRSDELVETIQRDCNSGFYPVIRMAGGGVGEVAYFSFNGYNLERSFRAGGSWQTEIIGRQGDGANLTAVSGSGDDWHLAFRTNRFNADNRPPYLLSRTGGTWHRSAPSPAARSCLGVFRTDHGEIDLVLMRDVSQGRKQYALWRQTAHQLWTENVLPFEGRIVPESFAVFRSSTYACGINAADQLVLIEYGDGSMTSAALADVPDDTLVSAVVKFDSKGKPVVVANSHRDGHYRIEVFRAVQ